jgi:hypothetical protein
MAAVKSTRDCPTEGLRVFAAEDRRKEEVVLGGKDEAVLGLLHSTLKLPESRIGLSLNCRPATYASNSPRSLSC